MPLSIKQARRMVAKSRRRVWRLARELRPTVMIIAGDNGLAGYYAETWIPETVREQRRPQMPEAQEVCSEFRRRLHVLWGLETEARGRAWARHLANAARAYIGPDLMEVPAYEMGELCRVCGAEMDWIECDHCGGEGLDGHDCGEDVCCCLYPEDNEQCDMCDGNGGWWQCYRTPHSEGAS